MKIVLTTFESTCRGLSIRYLSSYVEKLGHNCKLLFTVRNRGTYEDPKSFNLKEVEAIINFLKENKTDIFGMSTMTGDFLSAAKLAKKIKAKLPNLKIIMGGIHPSLCPNECLKEKSIDYVCIGEGEYPIKKLLENCPIDKIEGLGFTKNNKIIINSPNKNNLVDLSQVPFPDYQFANHYILKSNRVKPLTIKEYRRRTAWGGTYYYLTTTRGCPYRCSYCCNYNRMKPRRNSVERVMEELHYVKKIMPFIKGINIQDDSFYMGSDQYISNFCMQLKKNFNLPFIARIMPRFTTKERVRTLKSHGLEHVSIGLQGSERLNKQIYHRNENNKSFIEACEILYNENINYVVDVILDNPYETKDDLKEVVDTLNATPKPFTVLTYGLTPFPSTQLFQKAIDDGNLYKFGSDPYRSMFQASRPNTYKTPRHWRDLILMVSPMAPPKLINEILRKDPDSQKGKLLINKASKRYKRRIKFGHKIKNWNPTLFRLALNIYRKII